MTNVVSPMYAPELNEEVSENSLNQAQSQHFLSLSLCLFSQQIQVRDNLRSVALVILNMRTELPAGVSVAAVEEWEMEIVRHYDELVAHLLFIYRHCTSYRGKHPFLYTWGGGNIIDHT